MKIILALYCSQLKQITSMAFIKMPMLQRIVCLTTSIHFDNKDSKKMLLSSVLS